MNDDRDLTGFERRIEAQYGLKRSVLLAVGAGCVALGGLSAAMPVWLYGSLIQMIGVLLLLSGAIKASQLVLGRRSAKERRRSWPIILAQVALDVLMGVLLINHWRASVGLITTVLGLLFLGEGILSIFMAFRSPSNRSFRGLMLTGIVACGISVAVLARLVNNPLIWVGLFVGLKLATFGGVLIWIAVRSLKSDDALVYESEVVVPIKGELYAVYFGTAFHLGVSIGEGEIVHYLDDNHVHRVTWETFLEARSPQHWTYPDLPVVPPEVVVNTALSEVGKVYPYDLLKFNCEHFAVFCKSGGVTNRSKYAQLSGGVANFEKHPFLAMVAELNTRLVEWLAFQFGGASGKELSLAIRRFGCLVTNWLAGPPERATSPLESPESKIKT